MLCADAGCRSSLDRQKGMQITTVIFACIHSAGRSQMAVAFYDWLADSSKAEAVSAALSCCELVGSTNDFKKV